MERSGEPRRRMECRNECRRNDAHLRLPTVGRRVLALSEFARGANESKCP